MLNVMTTSNAGTVHRTRSGSVPGKGKTMTIEESAWTGMVPVDDAALAVTDTVTDTGGAGVPVLCLNSQFATRACWRHMIAELRLRWRRTTHERAGPRQFEADGRLLLRHDGPARHLLGSGPRWWYTAYPHDGLMPPR